MHSLSPRLMAGFFMMLATTAVFAAKPVDMVDPMIGTAAHGHTFPGATLPFGMVQLSPDTRDDTWDGCSGYHFSDDSIQGFSHNHLSGTGCGDLGNVLVLPLLAAGSGPIDVKPAKFSHGQETAKAGYYAVTLSDSGIKAELTATTRAGFHRYTFPAGKEGRHVIVFNLAHGIANQMIDAKVTVLNNHEISGFRKSNGWGGQKSFFFDAQFSQPFTSPKNIVSTIEKMVDGKKESRPSNVEELTFDSNSAKPLLIKVGLSSVSIEGARANLKAEIPAWDFDGIAAMARKTWDDEMSKLTVEGDDAVLKTFYTAYYHALIAPNLLSDVDGQYRGPDEKVHRATGGEFYTTLSLWDTYRAEQPLLTIVDPKRIIPLIDTFLDHARDFDLHTLPVWTDGGKENWCMIGNHSIPVIVDAYFKGFRNFDTSTALAAMVRTTERSQNEQDQYQKYGYIPSDTKKKDDLQSVSRTLEYAYDDACIARFANALGQSQIAKKYAKRASNWKNVLDPQTHLMRGKNEDATWVTPFDPYAIQFRDYTEANAWQYTFHVQQDVRGLADAMGGDDDFVKQLDNLFDSKHKLSNDLSDVTGLIGMFAQGNEPSHHVPYLYSYAGRADKTQLRARQVMALYTEKNDGLCGNDDCGQMSAWYVFSALGFYPVDPASSVYVIGSPLVNSASIKAPTGKTFKIVAENNSGKNMYIQSATLNGKTFVKTWLSHDEILAGGELKLVMGPTPNEKWGASEKDRPPVTAFRK